MTSPAEQLARSLPKARREGDHWRACCLAHLDENPSMTIKDGRDGKILLKCWSNGCSYDAMVAGAKAKGIWPNGNGSRLSGNSCFGAKREGESSDTPPEAAQPRNHTKNIGGKPQFSAGHKSADSARWATQPCSTAATGLSLAQYAAAKELPVDFLRAVGLSDVSYAGAPAVRIPYFGTGGELLAVRFRIALEGDRFRWKTDSKSHLYGLNRLAEARAAGHVTLVEGESDCHTLWHHGIPALGLPGATNWREDRDASYLDGIEIIYVIVEPDHGGEAVKRWLAGSSIRHRVKVLQLSVKDVSELHLRDPEGFKNSWKVALLGAIPWTTSEDKAETEARFESWEQCKDLAQCPKILEAFETELRAIGVVGESRLAKLLYLAVTSRLLDRPVSVAVKGPSSGGKSFSVESVLRFFPLQAFYALTAMSERALAYSTEPIKHRHLVIYEAAGMAGEFATYLIRSLLSEGRLRYETVEKTKDGLTPKVIEREGPTGLIVTTTSLRLHPENETRMLSLTVTDTQEQTAGVFRSLARRPAKDIDLGKWQALQIWIATEATEVEIPYAERLAELVPPLAVRLRRDFKTLLMLIRAHALLHQAIGRKDEDGRIIAEIQDYATVRDLVADLVAEGVEAKTKPEIREVVNAVAGLIASGKAEVMQSDLVKALKIDKSSIQRRVAAALAQGVLRNLEDRKGRPSRLVFGEPLSDEMEILPLPERLQRLHTVAQRGENENPEFSASSNERLHGCMANGEINKQCLDRGQSPLDCCSECGAAGRPGDDLIVAWEGADRLSLHRLCASVRADRLRRGADGAHVPRPV